MRTAARLAVLEIVVLAAIGCGRLSVPGGSAVQLPDGHSRDCLVDVTETTGLDFVHDVGPLGTYFMPQSMGSGAALWDFDRDGRLDILLVGGVASDAAPERGAGRDRLMRQTATGVFSNVSAAAGIDGSGFGMGTAVGDIDNDGFP